jgi:hypothetical protein
MGATVSARRKVVGQVRQMTVDIVGGKRGWVGSGCLVFVLTNRLIDIIVYNQRAFIVRSIEVAKHARS